MGSNPAQGTKSSSSNENVIQRVVRPWSPLNFLSLSLSLSLYIYIYIALWCKNQIEHSIWDESLLLCNCACSLEYSSLSTLAGLSYHICGKLEVAFKASPSSQHQHCSDEAQKAETVLSAVIYIIDNC